MALITRYYYTLLDRSHVVLDSRTLWTDIKTLQEQSFVHKVLHRFVQWLSKEWEDLTTLLSFQTSPKHNIKVEVPITCKKTFSDLLACLCLVPTTMATIVVLVSSTLAFSITTPFFFTKNVTRTPRAILIFLASNGFTSLGESVLFGRRVDSTLSTT